MKFKIDKKICLVIFLFIIFNKLELYILFMFFAIIHEMFHLLTGVILGYKVKKIKVEIIGFSMEFYEKQQKNNDNMKKIIILLAGPIFNILISLIFASLGIPIIFYINIVIAIFNLIPIYPLDGGQILNRLLRILYGTEKAYKITNSLNTIIMSIITAISSILILYIRNISIVIILIFMWYLVFKENKKYKEIQKYFKYVHKLDKKSNYNI